jgi:hypothetical protein
VRAVRRRERRRGAAMGRLMERKPGPQESQSNPRKPGRMLLAYKVTSRLKCQATGVGIGAPTRVCKMVNRPRWA